MEEQLVYLGDITTFSLELGKVTSIDSITDVVTSTRENLPANINLQYERVEINFRLNSNDSYYSDWYNLKEFEVDLTKTFANIYTDPSYNTNVEIQYKLIDIPNTWDEDEDYIEISNVSIDSTPVASNTTTLITTTANVSAIGNDVGVNYQQNHYYDPYELGNAEKLHDDLVYMATELYGHNVEYVKVRENTDKGVDKALREFNLFRVTSDDVKCLKVIVPNNDFADNALTFNPYGVDYGSLMEVHVSNTYFQKIFDKRTIPSERDFLYFPLENRMYEVVSAYQFKNFNRRPSYWKLTLSKYEIRKDVIIEDSTITEKLNDKLKGLESEFQESVVKEGKDLTNDNQLKLNDNNLDSVRVYINPAMNYLNKDIVNYFTLISDSQYNLNFLWKQYEEPSLAVSYKKKFSVAANKASTITMLASLSSAKGRSLNVSIVNVSGNQYKITLATGEFSTDYGIGDNISLWKKDGRTKTFTAVASIDAINNDRNEITCTTKTVIDINDVDLVSLSIDRTLFASGDDSYDIELKSRNFTLDTYANRLKSYITERDAITLEYFGNSFTYNFEESLSEDVWYAFVFSFNLRFKQMSISVYEVEGNTNTSAMTLVDSFVEQNFDSTGKTTGNQLNLLSAPLKVTNIRVFTESLDAELHSSYLSRNIIDNGGDIIIVDNALPNLKLQSFDQGQLF